MNASISVGQETNRHETNLYIQNLHLDLDDKEVGVQV